MTVKFISGYFSYKDCQLWIPHLQETKGEDVVEASGGTKKDAPEGQRIGAVTATLKEHHISRYMTPSSDKLTYLSTTYSSDKVPSFPEDAHWMGVFYLGRLGESYQGDKDTFADQEVSPDYGDVVFISKEETYAPGNVTEGENHRFYVFWRQEQG